MHPVRSLLERIRSHFEADPDLHRVVLNASSWVEANLAVELLAESLSDKALVTVANIREVLKELPQCPLALTMDLEDLARVWGLEREGNAWSRTFADVEGPFTIVLLGDGNCCYDIVVRADGRTHMWMPNDRDGDFLNPDIVDLIVARPDVAAAVVDLLETAGHPFYPMFYMSVEDWRQEYAQDVFQEVLHDFSLEGGAGAPSRRPAEEDIAPRGAEVRVRGVADEGRITWLI